jgi:hypothetical protein
MHVATPPSSSAPLLPGGATAAHPFVFARDAARDALHITLLADDAADDAGGGREAEEKAADASRSASTPLPRGLHAALLAGMRAGGRRKAVLPPWLGYGAAGVRRTLSARHAIVVPPNATLLFFLEALPAAGGRDAAHADVTACTKEQEEAPHEEL